VTGTCGEQNRSQRKQICIEPSRLFRRQQFTLTPRGAWSAAGSRWRPSSGKPEIASGRFYLLPSGAAPVAVGLLSKGAIVLRS
jgi:hypothetical protein